MLRIGRRKENCFPCYPIRLRRLFFRVFSPCQKQLLLMGFSTFGAPTNVRFPPLNRPIFFSPSPITERRFFYPIYVHTVRTEYSSSFLAKRRTRPLRRRRGDFSRKIRKRLGEKEKEEEEAPSRTRKVGKQSPTKRKGKRFAHKNNVWKFS